MNKIKKYLLFTMSLFCSLSAFENNGAAVSDCSIYSITNEEAALWFTKEASELVISNEVAIAELSIIANKPSNPFQCDFCKKYFSQKNNLTTHKRTHTGEKPYQCDYCNKCFNRKNILKNHERTHTGEKPYQCDYCNKYFTEQGHLKRHKKTHTGEKPYQCKTCEKCFAEKETLTDHVRIHTGEKPYQCDSCGRCFSQKNNLKKHEKLHILSTGAAAVTTPVMESEKNE
ncbi:hypothetical protein K9K77_00835 [Candidatus Babeliales bacterium]|nr:hypothetical protein [Candidatus Babeliales bacterium]